MAWYDKKVECNPSMASVAVSELPKTQHDELCCVFAMLILHDEGLEITADKINKLVDASGNTIEKYWPSVFGNAVKNHNITTLLANVGAGGAVAAAPAAASTTGAAPAAEKKEDVKDEPADALEEGGLDLFGGGEEW